MTCALYACWVPVGRARRWHLAGGGSLFPWTLASGGPVASLQLSRTRWARAVLMRHTSLVKEDPGRRSGAAPTPVTSCPAAALSSGLFPFGPVSPRQDPHRLCSEGSSRACLPLWLRTREGCHPPGHLADQGGRVPVKGCALPGCVASLIFFVLLKKCFPGLLGALSCVIFCHLSRSASVKLSLGPPGRGFCAQGCRGRPLLDVELRPHVG